MGGAFDPIHYAHLLDAEQAREALGLDEVVFVPNNRPPFVKHGLASNEHRLEMTQLAVADNPAFSVSAMETERGGVSYSIDTVTSYHEEYPDLDELYFVTGADAIAALDKWRRYEELVMLCAFVVVTRPGYDLAALESTLPAVAKGRVRFLPTPALEISSTDLRERVRQGRSIRYLTPPAVADYIEAHGLYRDAAEG
jgi:nicotinate-nucleotide adenylyltransferase